MQRLHYSLLLSLLSLVLFSGCARGPETTGSLLGNGAAAFEDMIDVRLEGATNGPAAEVFGKVVSSAPSVTSATRYSSRIVPDNPQASWVIWRAIVAQGTSSFILQTEMMDMFKEVVGAGGYVDLYGIPYRYNSSEIALLKGLRPMEATSRSLTFVVDRELARDREMAGY